MTLFLQLWGGLFYLANKYFFAKAERSSSLLEKHRLQLSAWVVYLLGLPAWVAIFIHERDWIAAAVESGGAPAMVIGILIAIKGRGKEPKWLDYISHIFIAGGLSLSFYEFGGFGSINQVLELTIAIGFLLGTYSAAKEMRLRYYWFVLGNLSCAALMARQGYLILMTQQLLSLVFVVDAHLTLRRKTKEENGGVHDGQET